MEHHQHPQNIDTRAMPQQRPVPTVRPKKVSYGETPSQYSVMQEDHHAAINDSEQLMCDHRQTIGRLILENAPIDVQYKIATDIFSLNLPFQQKYEILDLWKILNENQRSDLQKIPVALNILQKYSTNLLKPEKDRHLSWRTVLLSSNAFQQKVRFLNNGIQVLRSLGYSSEIKDENGSITALQIPLDQKPNFEHVMDLSIDLALAKFEVDAIINGSHPNFDKLQFTGSIPDVYFTYSMKQNKTLPLRSSIEHDSLPESSSIPLAINSPRFPGIDGANDSNYVPPEDQTKQRRSLTDGITTERKAHTSVLSSKDGLYCPHCKKLCDSSAKFCQDCGYSLGNIRQPQPDLKLANQKETANSSPETWQCRHCTFLNDCRTNVCAICDKTSWVSGNDQYQKINEAQQKIDLNQKNDMKIEQQPPKELPSTRYTGIHMVQTVPPQKSGPDWFPANNVGPYVSMDPKNLGFDRSSMFRTAPLYQPIPTFQHPGTSLLHDKKQKLRDAEFKKKKEQDRIKEEQHRQQVIEDQNKMKENAERLVFLLKYAEKNSFTVEECYLATLKVEVLDPEHIQVWLRNELPPMVENFVSFCNNDFGQDSSIGLISFNEAKQFLVFNDGIQEQGQKKFVKDRKKKVNDLSNEFKECQRADVLDALYKADGDEEKAKVILQNIMLKEFRERIWHGVGRKSRHFYDRLLNDQVSDEVKCRMLMAEHEISLGRAKNCLKLIGKKTYLVNDCIKAVESCQSIDLCVRYLSNECETCMGSFPVHELATFLHCQCRICYECYSNHISVCLNEKHIRHLVCPICGKPEMDGPIPPNYFDNLSQQIKDLVSKELLLENMLEQFETKLRDFSLLKEEKFRWCSQCGNGFLWEDGANLIRMTCDRCQAQACYLCKEKWEDQHQGITCQQFKEWKNANDPELQRSGVEAILAKNGLECPDCHFKYDLARGGCIHFTCTQCGYQFCNGCDQAFRNNCNIHPERGLHAHHPRDCLYFLRDNSVPELQKLLTDKNVKFDTEIPEEKQGIGNLKCSMMEQKEIDGGLQDKECGREAPDNMAGICELHYKEYLVGLINRHGVDPIEIMLHNEIEALFQREGNLQILLKKENESEELYLQNLKQYTRENIPLLPRKEHIKPAGIFPDLQNELLNPFVNAFVPQFVPQFGSLMNNDDENDVFPDFDFLGNDSGNDSDDEIDPLP